MDDVNYIICIILVIGALIFGIFIGAIINDGQKFCPECGARYSKSVSYCHFDGTELIMKGEH